MVPPTINGTMKEILTMMAAVRQGVEDQIVERGGMIKVPSWGTAKYRVYKTNNQSRVGTWLSESAHNRRRVSRGEGVCGYRATKAMTGKELALFCKPSEPRWSERRPRGG